MSTPSDRPSDVRFPLYLYDESKLLDPIPLARLAEALRGEPPVQLERADRTRGGEASLPLNTADAPWRLVLPVEASDGPSAPEIRGALEPLSTRRQALEPLFFAWDRARPVQESISVFFDANADELGKTAYLLLAGLADDLPFALQQRLAIGKLVGRLSFSTLSAYSQYAAKVVAAETSAPERPVRPILTFGTDSDPATELSHTAVAQPMWARLQARYSGRVMPSLLAEDATRDKLLEALRGDADPSLLFCAGHGAEDRTPNGALQGALMDQNHNIVYAGDFGETFPAALRYGIAVIFACNSGGTPMDRWWPAALGLPRLNVPETDISAPLPTAWLAHLEGPLAVIAHVDVTSDQGFRTYGGLEPTGVDSPGVIPLRNLVFDLAEGTPAGLAMRSLCRKAGECEQQLADRLFIQQRLPRPLTVQDDEDLAAAWLQWHDHRYWMLVGDPRVCVEGVRGQATLLSAMRGGVERSRG